MLNLSTAPGNNGNGANKRLEENGVATTKYGGGEGRTEGRTPKGRTEGHGRRQKTKERGGGGRRDRVGEKETVGLTCSLILPKDINHN